MASTDTRPTPSAATTVEPSVKNKKNKKKKKATAHAVSDDDHGQALEETDNGTSVAEASGGATSNTEDRDAEEEKLASKVEGSAHENVAKQPESDGTGSKAQNEDEGNSDDPHNADGDAQARLEALLQDRTALRVEVTKLRKSLEDIQSKHAEHITVLDGEIAAERTEKESAQEQYQSLLGRVNTLRTQLTERLKADAEQLADARGEIEQLHSQNTALRAETRDQSAELQRLTEEQEAHVKELSTLRNRAVLSQQNWDEEREDLIQREAYAREELENAKQAMSDWEVLAMEERNMRHGLDAQVTELQEELHSSKEAHDKAKQQLDTQFNAVEGLQKGLQEIQDARKKELRDIVERTETEILRLRRQVEQAQAAQTESARQLGDMLQERDRLVPLEAELKEKNLLIGKLRHEAVILNDHLTKALRQLKRGKTEDAIDRQLVTNHFLQFLGLAHGDPKKFQILQIMAAMLNWNEEQREQAGLARPGTSNPSLRTPISPWHRTPSTPTLNAANLGAASGETGQRKETIAGLFSDFLESEAEGGSSKATSISGSSRPNS